MVGKQIEYWEGIIANLKAVIQIGEAGKYFDKSIGTYGNKEHIGEVMQELDHNRKTRIEIEIHRIEGEIDILRGVTVQHFQLFGTCTAQEINPSAE